MTQQTDHVPDVRKKGVTAVELLEAQLMELISFNTAEMRELYRNKFKQAKEMEKEQSLEFFTAGQDSMEEGGKSFDQYYNETHQNP